MKKFFAFALSALLVFSLAACSTPDSSSAPAASTPSSAEASSVAPEPVDVEVTIPASLADVLFSEEGQTMEDYAASFEAEDGVKEVTQNEDGSLTIVMTEEAQERLLGEWIVVIDATIDTYVDGETTPSIKSVEYNDDLSVFTFTVDKAAFEGSEDEEAALIVVFYALHFQAIAGMGDAASVTIDVVDEATGETFNSVAFPEALQDAA